MSEGLVPNEALLDYQRGHSRFTPEAPEENPSAEDAASAILGQLTEHQRQIFEMRAMAGMRHKEIGEIMWPGEDPKVAANRSKSVYTYTLHKIRHLARTPEEIQQAIRRREAIRVRKVQTGLARAIGGDLSISLLSALDTTHSGASHSI